MSPASAANRAWNLESFLDSLIVELDKARDTLAVKGMTRPLTYTVQDIELEVQVFPVYDGDQVRFVTAEPGQQGASKLGVQLGSITARGIQETTTEPITKDDIAIELLDEIPNETKSSLRKLGVKSVKDLERLEERDVDLEKVTKQQLDYGNLAKVVNKARRRQLAPTVSRVGVTKSKDGLGVLSLTGDNLALAHGEDPAFPIAMLDGEPLEVVRASATSLEMKVDLERLAGRSSELRIALDRYATMTLELKA